jgi:truncated hemoglobin YjbI
MSEKPDAHHDAIQRTRDSLGRCVECVTFLDRFYELFTKSSAKVAELFKDTDFVRQKQVLKASLYEMLVAAGTTKGPAHDELERLAKLHQELGVTEDMYQLWLDALVRAAREHDRHFTDELENDWRASMSGPIQLMKAGG